MTAQSTAYLSENEYLEREHISTIKHEYYAGEIFAMSGASEAHNLIASNVNASIYAQTRGRGCRIYPSDMRIKVIKTGLYTYPDITVVCGQPEFAEAKKRDTLLNPTVIIEILSPSTERYDRGLKFQHYRTIESLKEYILIAQNTYHIERYIRHDPQMWILSEAIGIEATIRLESIQCGLALADVYELVELAPESPIRTND
ncbi:Uma2 family endonuclease [Candidatus Oscillochloris fontis]|uniref:Uma2 family endonuclease n=1 Tax=Candidatus Oscillochloris fontis TaxID=2496868 RepID=UPI00101D581C|nr:Uma2 family endonuclease [Candidatus Oscillochloris fontis]